MYAQPDAPMTVEQVCQHLSVGRALLRRLIREKDFPKPKIEGKRYVFSRHEVTLWLQLRKVHMPNNRE